MAFIPFFKRPEPGAAYLDKVVASVEVAGIYVGVTNRGICIELTPDSEEDEETEEDED
jgi:hypothetical protein